MAEYKGSISLISGLTQANNGEFPLVDAGAVNVSITGDGTPQSTSGKSDRLDTILAKMAQSIGGFKWEIVTSLPPANESQHGKIVLFLDNIEETDDVMICLRIKGVYQWCSMLNSGVEYTLRG